MFGSEYNKRDGSFQQKGTVLYMFAASTETFSDLLEILLNKSPNCFGYSQGHNSFFLYLIRRI